MPVLFFCLGRSGLCFVNRQPETQCAMERRRFADMLINQRSLI